MKKGKPKARNIGVDVTPPKETCEDKNCAFHGKIGLRGRTFVGTVIGGDTHRTARVEWIRQFYIPKYERYEKRRSKIQAHNPPCINAQKGDKVKIMECRPISKTKNFVIIEKIK
jgi:small subunit ribosomal protein S17